MDVLILAVGRLKSGPETELCGRFLERARKAGRPLGFRSFEVTELGEGRAARTPDRIAQEEAALREALAGGPRGPVVCLDEGGDMPDSDAFARQLRQDCDAGTARTTFVIGGPDGLGEGLVRAADRRIAFGRMTVPHQIARILLAEQLYRAVTILSGHPYHRA